MRKYIVKKISIILVLVLFFGMLDGCFINKVDAYTNDEIKVYLNGDLLYFDQPPVVEDGRTLVPVRTLAEAIGSFVEWDEESQTAIIQRGLDTAVFKIGENKAYARNIRNLDVPAKVINGRTLIPLRAVSEIFNARVEWDGSTRVIKIICPQYTQADIVKDFTNFGFYKFDYFRESFYDEHVNNIHYPWIRIFSEIGDWGSRIIAMPWSSYEKECYKEVIENILNSSLLSDVAQEPEKFSPWVSDIVTAIKNGLEIDVDEMKRKYGGNQAELKEIESAIENYGRIKKLIKWSNFTLEEINYLYTDYSHNIKYLDSVLYATSASEDSEELEKAVLDLKKEYTNKWAGLVNDGGEVLTDFISSKLTDAVMKKAGANTLYSVVTFAVEKTMDITGGTEYADNVENAMVISMLSSRLIFEFDEMGHLFYDISSKKTKSQNDWQWNEYVTLFDITKAAMIEMYTCMLETTKNSAEKTYLRRQIDIMKKLRISQKLPELVDDMFYFDSSVISTYKYGQTELEVDGKVFVANSDGISVSTNGVVRKVLNGSGYDNGFVTNGEVIFFYDKNDVKIKKITISNGNITPVADAYKDFDTAWKDQMLIDAYYKEGYIFGCNNEWLYFSEMHGGGDERYYVLNLETGKYNEMNLDVDLALDFYFYGDKIYYSQFTYGVGTPTSIREATLDGLKSKNLFHDVYSYCVNDGYIYFLQIKTTAIADDGWFDPHHLVSLKCYNLNTKEVRVLKDDIVYEDYESKYNYNLLTLLAEYGISVK